MIKFDQKRESIVIAFRKEAPSSCIYKSPARPPGIDDIALKLGSEMPPTRSIQRQ